jgi:hypothetical protein
MPSLPALNTRNCVSSKSHARGVQKASDASGLSSTHASCPPLSRP